MSEPQTAALIRVLADNKHQLGLRYAAWATGAPTLEAATAAAAMAQAELGHARALAPLLQAAPGRSGGADADDRPPEYYARLLDAPFASWTQFVAVNALFDAALTTIVAALRESSYAPLRGRAQKIVAEERYHAAHGAGWLRRLGQAGGAAQVELGHAVADIWDETLCLFGPDEDALLAALHHAGVIAAGATELRQQYLREAQPLLAAAGLPSLPADRLPWDRWDSIRRRLG